MSIPVDAHRLGEVLAEFGSGYLLTTDGTHVKAVTVEAELRDGRLVVENGSGGTARNLATNPTVTVLFPPPEPRGYTLLVDGTGTGTEKGFEITPDSAVLHRPAGHADGPPAPAGLTKPASDGGCGQDCAPVTAR